MESAVPFADRQPGQRTLLGAALILAALAVAGTVFLLSPRAGLAHRIPAGQVSWIDAAEDLLPVRPAGGATVRTLAQARYRLTQTTPQFTYAFQADGAMEGPQAIYLPFAGPDTRIFVNNVPVALSRTSRPVRSLLLLGEPAYAPIPAGLFSPGRNQLTIIAAGDKLRASPRTICFGPAGPLRENWQRQLALAGWLPSLIALLGSAGAALGLSAAAIWPRLEGWLAQPSLLALTLAAAGLVPALGPAWADSGWTALVQDAALALAAIQLLLLVHIWRVGPSAPPRLAVAALVLVFLPIPVAAGLAAVCEDACTLVAMDLSQAGMSLTILTAVCLGGMTMWAARDRLSKASIAQLTLAILVATGLLSAALAHRGELGASAGLLGETGFAMAILLAMLGWSLLAAWRVVRAALGAAQGWLGLRRLVGEQDRTIQKQRHELENEVRRRAVAEERERFARDIHDGLGGTLSSLLLRIRAGKISTADIASAVESGLDDLRLMVDALDLQATSISATLNTFHTRIAPHFAAAGIELVWVQEDRLTSDIARPETILNLFRILQEAATNIVRHSGASQARFTFSWSEIDQSLLVQIADNGRDSPDAASLLPATRGGLRNMTDRASRVGGVLSVRSDADRGWVIELRLPVS